MVPAAGSTATRSQPVGARVDMQLVGVDEIVQLRAEHERQPGERGDDEERRDQDAGIEMQSQHQRPDRPAPGHPSRDYL